MNSPIINVYNNLPIFCEYRGIKTSEKFLGKQDLLKTININTYIKIRGTCDDRYGARKMLIMLFATKSPYISSSPDFKKIMRENVPEYRALLAAKALAKSALADSATNKPIEPSPGLAASDHPTHLIIIAEAGFSSHINNIIAEMQKHIYVEICPYERFVIVIPRHVAVPKHEFATEEEIRMLTEDYFIDPKNQAAILDSDPPLVWLGARKGAIIKITRDDENAGTSIAFRIVV